MTAPTSAELLPCPFCGSEAKLFGALHAWAVICTGCDSYGPSTSKYEAITAWNRRAAMQTAEPVAYTPVRVEQLSGGRTVTTYRLAAPDRAPSTELPFDEAEFQRQVEEHESIGRDDVNCEKAQFRNLAVAPERAPSTDSAADDHINDAIKLDAARYEFVRKLNPCDFERLVSRNIAGEGKFDDLVDAARGVK